MRFAAKLLLNCCSIATVMSTAINNNNNYCVNPPLNTPISPSSSIMSTSSQAKNNGDDQATGYNTLRDPYTNKGLALTDESRSLLKTRGLLPVGYVPIEVQVQTALKQIRERSTPMDKYLYLDSIRDCNAQLFFALLVHNTEELLPIVYTPTVGAACLEFSQHFLPRPKGLFLSITDKGNIKEILRSWPQKDIKVIVHSDGERILGLGDLGANGMGIPLGKAALYTALGGIPPDQCLGVTIDVGTNNETFLRDPAYIGLRQNRVRGEEYDEFIKEFMESAMEVYGPDVLLQWEDYGNSNAFRLREDWAQRSCSFNDDIEGTASVVLAGLLAAKRLTNRPLDKETFLFLGAGEAALGIADLIAYAIHKETGVSLQAAKDRIWLVDSKGLIVEGREHLTPHKLPYAHPHEKARTFLEAVKSLKPTGIIGVSTVAKAFNKEVLETMVEANEQPIIFALSNPTSKAECTFEEAVEGTKGKCIFASGSPFSSYKYQDRVLVPGQANNCFIFPGIGLGVKVAGIKRITMEDFYIASRTLANMVGEDQLNKGCLFPPLHEVRDVSAAIAAGLAEDAKKMGRLNVPDQKDWFAYAKSLMYNPLPPHA